MPINFTRRKPPQGDPCTRCGICCIAGPCAIGLQAGANPDQSCHLLTVNPTNGEFSCSLMEGPHGALFQLIIGAGTYCDSGNGRGEPDEVIGMTAIEFMEWDGGEWQDNTD